MRRKLIVWEDPDELGYRLVPAEPEVPEQVAVTDDGSIVTEEARR